MASHHINGAQNGVPAANYCAYLDTETKAERIGSLTEDRQFIQPLSFASGTSLQNLYEVIEAGDSRIIASGEPIERSSTKLLAPINGRDILCVGKNYAAHATEFNKSGYDSSDKVDQPTYPVIFTKRFSSIIADGDEIYPHPKFTNTIDYEGELGVIIGKSGFRISEVEAMDYVWGYTIVNDMTARERQRDHKQFYLGKSPDTYCPMGPIAVPKREIQGDLTVQTRVNGELRQNATTNDLIFSIPYLIMTLSEGQTLMPGDVLATGTPAGVGFGQDPPNYLQPGDVVSVSITGLGSLTNRIASKSSINPTVQQIKQSFSSLQHSNAAKSLDGVGLTRINGKNIHYRKSGAEDGSDRTAVFVHGLGGTMDYWDPLIDAADLGSTHTLHLYEFEGHGLSPTSPLSELTLDSLATDLKGIFDSAEISGGATLFAHSMGCLVAVQFVLNYPNLVSKLILFGPPPSPLPEAGSKGASDRAALVRRKGIAAVVDAIVSNGVSEKTKRSNPVARTAVRLSLLGQDPEGYAKACSALAKSHNNTLAFSDISAETLIITGSEDKISPPKLCEKYASALPNAKGVKVLEHTGHWHNYENPNGAASAILAIL